MDPSIAISVYAYCNAARLHQFVVDMLICDLKLKTACSELVMPNGTHVKKDLVRVVALNEALDKGRCSHEDSVVPEVRF